jgi:membrane protease YdiL (CAAX protease family)
MLQEERMRPNWPAWYGLAALGIALVVALFASGILFALLAAVGANVDSNSPGVTLAATLIQDGALVVAALWLAAKVAPPRPEQFGIRSLPFLRGLKWAAIAFAIFFAFQILYVAAVHPDQKQTTLNDLGAGSSIAVTILIGVLVVGVAPAVEEFFFRGFFYGALRNRFSFAAAALLDGLVFGAVHAPTGIQAVPTLVVLGIAFCIAYEATGSILPGIVLHSLNNMVAFGSDKQGDWAVGGVTAALVLVACVTIPRRSRTLT